MKELDHDADDYDCEAICIAHETARAHARAIVDAAKHSLRGGSPWAGVPLEAEAMTAAICKRMRIGSKMGQTDIPVAVIRRAVEGVLEA